MSMTKQSSDYFEQVAGSWDDIRSGYFSEALRQSAIDRAYLRPEMTVADVGAGTGFMAAGLAPRVKKVHVVDGAPAMLDVARKNLAAFSNVEYHQGESESLPLKDGSVDVVFANMYLHHCIDPLAAIKEMARLLRPGGRLVITDMDKHDDEWAKEEMADVWLGFERPQVRAWFEQAGLVNVIVDCSGESCCAESHESQVESEVGHRLEVSVFVAIGTRRVSGVREAVQNTYSAIASESGSSCCGSAESKDSSSCCSTGATKVESDEADQVIIDPGYSLDELASVPTESATISLGCGNPVALAAMKPGEAVLDIGSGGGLDSFLAAQRVGPTGKVIGVDMTPAMLERARKAAKKAGLENVEFRRGQAEALPLEDGEVDVVISNCVINLSEDKGKVFAEAYRVLKEGGRLEVSDIVTDKAIPPGRRENPEDWPGCVMGALPEREYLDLVAQAGFKDISAKRSPSLGEAEGVKAYSLGVSARKVKEGSSEVKTTSVSEAPRRSKCCS